MAKVIACSWFPRSHIHLFETYHGLNKVQLTIDEVKYRKELSFKIKAYKEYPIISFTQTPCGMHFFTADLPDEGIEISADLFMKQMQMLLIEKILKECHSVTYKQIVADIMPLDFHVLVLSKKDIPLGDYSVEEADKLKIYHQPEDDYFSGMKTYITGSDDLDLMNILSYHAYTEVASDMLYSMMKAMVRLYHEADNVVYDFEYAESIHDMREPMKVLDEIIKETSERYGKLEQVLLNFETKQREYESLKLKEKEKKIAQALDIGYCFKKIIEDGQYMKILWSNVLERRLRDIDETLDAQVMMIKDKKKVWPF